jgi:hypothetical protein
MEKKKELDIANFAITKTIQITRKMKNKDNTYGRIELPRILKIKNHFIQ